MFRAVRYSRRMILTRNPGEYRFYRQFLDCQGIAIEYPLVLLVVAADLRLSNQH